MSAADSGAPGGRGPPQGGGFGWPDTKDAKALQSSYQKGGKEAKHPRANKGKGPERGFGTYSDAGGSCGPDRHPSFQQQTAQNVNRNNRPVPDEEGVLQNGRPLPSQRNYTSGMNFHAGAEPRSKRAADMKAFLAGEDAKRTEPAQQPQATQQSATEAAMEASRHAERRRSDEKKKTDEPERKERIRQKLEALGPASTKSVQQNNAGSTQTAAVTAQAQTAQANNINTSAADRPTAETTGVNTGNLQTPPKDATAATQAPPASCSSSDVIEKLKAKWCPTVQNVSQPAEAAPASNPLQQASKSNITASTHTKANEELKHSVGSTTSSVVTAFKELKLEERPMSKAFMQPDGQTISTDSLNVTAGVPMGKLQPQEQDVPQTSTKQAKTSLTDWIAGGSLSSQAEATRPKAEQKGSGSAVPSSLTASTSVEAPNMFSKADWLAGSSQAPQFEKKGSDLALSASSLASTLAGTPQLPQAEVPQPEPEKKGTASALPTTFATSKSAVPLKLSRAEEFARGQQPSQAEATHPKVELKAPVPAMPTTSAVSTRTESPQPSQPKASQPEPEKKGPAPNMPEPSAALTPKEAPAAAVPPPRKAKGPGLESSIFAHSPYVSKSAHGAPPSLSAPPRTFVSPTGKRISTMPLSYPKLTAESEEYATAYPTGYSDGLLYTVTNVHFANGYAVLGESQSQLHMQPPIGMNTNQVYCDQQAQAPTTETASSFGSVTVNCMSDAGGPTAQVSAAADRSTPSASHTAEKTVATKGRNGLQDSCWNFGPK